MKKALTFCFTEQIREQGRSGLLRRGAISTFRTPQGMGFISFNKTVFVAVPKKVHSRCTADLQSSGQCFSGVGRLLL